MLSVARGGRARSSSSIESYSDDCIAGYAGLLGAERASRRL